jgi:hypothetical protein
MADLILERDLELELIVQEENFSPDEFLIILNFKTLFTAKKLKFKLLSFLLQVFFAIVQ